jgi:hypothetical protein
VYHALAVCVIESTCNGASYAQRVVDRELLLTIESLAERLTRHQRHDVEKKPVCLAGIEQRKDVRVLKVRGGTDLGQEAFASHYRSQLGMQNLDRYRAMMPKVFGHVHGRRRTSESVRAFDDSGQDVTLCESFGPAR